MGNLRIVLVFLWSSAVVFTAEENCRVVRGRKAECKSLSNTETESTPSSRTDYDYVSPELLRLVQAFEKEQKNISKVPSSKPQERICEQKCEIYNPIALTEEVIVGGKKVKPKEFLHMALIGYGEKEKIEWKCGGSLISKRFILTAAHCVIEEKPKFVRLGDLDLSTDKDDASPQDFTVTKIISHPSYEPPSRYHDIALLELNKEVNFTSYVRPACLATERQIYSEYHLTATGWGKTGFSEGASTFLLKVDLDYVPNDACQRAYRKIPKDKLADGIVDDLQICAGKNKGKDTCQGDSGGPLQSRNALRDPWNSYQIIGVTSFGKPCGLSGHPGVYTRVYSYLSWIESIAWQYE